MKVRIQHWVVVLILLLALLYASCQPLREFGNVPVYNGKPYGERNDVSPDPSKKTVVIVANNAGTEIFDLMAPYYLFSATGKANVYVVAEKGNPIVLLKGLYLIPHLTFAEADAMHIVPDVLVIPAMPKVHEDLNSPIVSWIKAKVAPETKMLSVCVGSLVAAATGLYDGKPLTTHASEYCTGRELFSNPVWVRDTAVTQSGNLYSTAGVSNAVEGSLTLIHELFGEEILHKVMRDIRYPYAGIKLKHKSEAIGTGNKCTIANKIFFSKNRRVGVLLHDGMDEFVLAAVLDSYNRTFPSHIDTYIANGYSVKSKYGLTLLPTGNLENFDADELHLLTSNPLIKIDKTDIENVLLVKYDLNAPQYIIDLCLKRIETQYGAKFGHITELLLDYNKNDNYE